VIGSSHQLVIPNVSYTLVSAELPFYPPSDAFDVGLAAAIGVSIAVLVGLTIGGVAAIRRYKTLQVWTLYTVYPSHGTPLFLLVFDCFLSFLFFNRFLFLF
jgi:hypothetical protein